MALQRGIDVVKVLKTRQKGLGGLVSFEPL
jgi:hypothetical protein